MNSDALCGWMLTAGFAIYLGVAIRLGRFPGAYLWPILKAETPGLFWFCVGLLALAIFVFAFMALYFTLPPLPSHPI